LNARRRWRLLAQADARAPLDRGPNRSLDETASTVRANIVEHPIYTIGAEGASVACGFKFLLQYSQFGLSCSILPLLPSSPRDNPYSRQTDIACLTNLGIDPASKRYLMLKSRVHWSAGFGTIAKAVIECAGTGVCTSDYSVLNFQNVRRPIFPLDLAADINPKLVSRPGRLRGT
jgi:hypothetical protein